MNCIANPSLVQEGVYFCTPRKCPENSALDGPVLLQDTWRCLLSSPSSSSVLHSFPFFLLLHCNFPHFFCSQLLSLLLLSDLLFLYFLSLKNLLYSVNLFS